MQGGYGYGDYNSYPPGPSNYYQQQQQGMPAYEYGGHVQQQFDFAPPGPPAHPVMQSGSFADELIMSAPPEVAVDPHAFRRFFMYHLSQLTFNSKPIITGLTVFAHHHVMRMASVVASCLEEHLRNCPPQMRLPGFYLLDSIAKNLGPPFVLLFARFIERTFLSAYHVVDPATKVKLEELLGTWRSGGPDGGELFRFPEEGKTGRVQRGIETVLYGAKGRGGGVGGAGRPLHENEAFMAGVNQQQAIANPAERSETLYDVRRALQNRLERQAIYPDDQRNNTQVSALQKRYLLSDQLEALVLDTKLTSEQVHQIRGQLAQLIPQGPDGMRSPMYGQPQANIGRTLTPIGSPLHAVQYQQFGIEQRPTPPLVPGSIDSDLLNRLKGLASSGGIPGLAAVAGQQVQQQQQAVSSAAAAPDSFSTKYEDEASAAFDAAIAALEIRLTNSDLQRYGQHAISFLYGRLPLQCNQCGLRFLDSPSGTRNMDKHLDWHFVTKRRIREGAGRAQGRSWFSSESDWLSGDVVSSEGVSADHNSTRGNAFGSSEADKSARGIKLDREALMKMKVVAPAEGASVDLDLEEDEDGGARGRQDDGASGGTSRICAICKEPFKSEWSEQDEEWVFWNAVQVDGKLYHATCHAEAAAARLKIQEEASAARASRDLTPVKSPLVGKKIIKEEESDATTVGTDSVTESARKRKADEVVETGDANDGVKRIKAEPAWE